MGKAVSNNLEVSHYETEAKDLSMINISFRIIEPTEAHSNRTVINTATIVNPTFREIKQIPTEAKAMAGVCSNSEDVAEVGSTIRVAMDLTSLSITHMTHTHKGDHDISNIMEKMSINPHQSQQGNLYP